MPTARSRPTAASRSAARCPARTWPPMPASWSTGCPAPSAPTSRRSAVSTSSTAAACCRCRACPPPGADPEPHPTFRNRHAMNNYRSPLNDLRFVIHQVLKASQVLATLPAHAETGAEIIDAVLEEGGRFCDQVIGPLYQEGDRGCRFENGSVTVPRGFTEAYRAFTEGGWSGLTARPEEGGQGLPYVVAGAFKEMINGANVAWGTFPLLGHGATEALRHYGEDWQKRVFLAPLVDGRWTGTMCLTEPHCGTDLGLLKTRAEPLGDG